jgi:hypothetical protein
MKSAFKTDRSPLNPEDPNALTDFFVPVEMMSTT